MAFDKSSRCTSLGLLLTCSSQGKPFTLTTFTGKLLLPKVYIFERQEWWERKRERKKDLLPAGFLPKWHQRSGLGQVEVSSLKLHLGLPQRWQWPKYLGHHLLLMLATAVGSEISSGAAGTETSAPTWDARITTGGLTHCGAPYTHSKLQSFLRVLGLML